MTGRENFRSEWYLHATALLTGVLNNPGKVLPDASRLRYFSLVCLTVLYAVPKMKLRPTIAGR